MRVVVEESIEVIEPDRLTELVVVSALAADGVGAVLRAEGAGDVADEHAWLDCEDLRRRAGALVDRPGWSKDFERMLDYARSNGWLDASGTRVRAHIVAE